MSPGGLTHTRLHASVVAVGTKAAIIRGASGAGKSDLLLRCLAVPPCDLVAEQPRLVADDQVLVQSDGPVLRVSSPPALCGKLEVRGVGIISVAVTGDAVAALIVELTAPDRIERLPDPWPVAEILGHRLPVLRLNPFECSAPLKLLAALSRIEQLAYP